MHTRTCTLFWCLLCLFVLQFYGSYARKKDSNALFLNCGSQGDETDSDGLKWIPDMKYIASGDEANMMKADSQDPSLPSDVPYMTARFFTAETTYKLPIDDGTKRVLLRLHFYPSSYPNFNISNSFFSVNAGGIALLNNFSASITAEALSQAYIIKEYFLLPPNPKEPTLDVTFKPSDQYKSSFGFVNGIEVIPSPDIFRQEAALVGLGTSNVDVGEAETLSVNDNSMEALYRLNVGGQFIPPSNDSGNLKRSWYDDSPYVYGGAVGITGANSTTEYGKLAKAIAPLEVYQTWRSMGRDGELNKKFNLTWLFQVDSNFSYIVRFHWCDFDATKPNQRVFDIFINNQTAESGADVFTWTKRQAKPMKKDYAIYVRDRPGGAELRVDFHPSVKEEPQWLDSLLNGLEIFKVSDAKSNLAGPNPTISDMMKKQLQQGDESKPHQFAPKKSNTGAIIGGAAGGAAAFGVAAALFFVAYSRKKKVPGNDQSGGNTSWLPVYGNSHSCGIKSSKSGSTRISSDAASNCRYFSLAEIKAATKNFDDSYVIGVGGFGKVYKGIMDDNTKVAIKRSNPSSEQGVNEFQTEIEMLSQLRHRHLVSLIGFCEEDNEMVLVYDYMGHGTLREHLYKNINKDRDNNILSWKQRLEICIGAARGLHYLHTGAKYIIIHRDVKTTNILLDDKWVAKVSDFGLSKTGPNMNQGHVSTVVKGSFGYLDPEYFRRQQLTEKSDVYSFGVVLFEVLCARPALNPNLSKEQVSLSDWALQCHRKGCIDDIIDPHLKGKINPECLNKFTETAVKCLADHGTDRPSMGDVLWNLEFALQLHDNPDGGAGPTCSKGKENDIADGEIDHKALLAMHRNTLSLDSDDDTTQGSDNNTNDVFSQIVNPKGR